MTACGDDGPTPTDGACVGHGCPVDGGAAITDPEGGQIIFEYMYFDSELQAAFQLPQGVTTVQRTMAHFINAQDPNSNPLPTAGICNNLESTKGWPLYLSAAATELDVGTLTIKGKNEAGTDVSLDIPKQPAGKDSVGRAHRTFYQNVTPDAGARIDTNARYTVTLGGAGAIPETTFDNLFISGGQPEGFTVNSPGFEENGPLVAGTDFPVKWTPGTSSNAPEGTEILGLTWLADSFGSPTHLCVQLHSAGAFTIPGSAITEFRAISTARGADPDHMVMLRQATVHNLSRLPNGEEDNKRRIDMLSITCWAQLMNVSAAP